MEAACWERVTVGKLGLVLMGGTWSYSDVLGHAQ